MKPSPFSSFIRKNATRLVIGFFIFSALVTSLALLFILFSRRPAPSLPALPFLPFLQTSIPAPTATATIAPALPSIPFTPTITPTSTPALTSTPLPPEGESFSIGKSVEGKPLDVYRFGSGPIVRVVIGAIHGGYESNTATLVYLLRDDIKNGLIVVPDDITLYLLPIFNPDGYYDYTNQPEGRANAHGVDINRNWDVYWKPDWVRTGCFNYIRLNAGEAPFSEPEAQALREFLSNNHVDALISYHSAMSAIFAGGRPEPDAASDSLARALSAVSFYLYPPVNDPGCEYTGQLIDWASAHGIAAVDVELTDHQSNDILINRNVLKVFLAWKR
jgi:hypothetical protein